MKPAALAANAAPAKAGFNRDDIMALCQEWANEIPANDTTNVIFFGGAAMVLLGLRKSGHTSDIDYLPTAQSLPLSYKLARRYDVLSDIDQRVLVGRSQKFVGIRCTAATASARFCRERSIKTEGPVINDDMDANANVRPFVPDVICYSDQPPLEFVGEQGGKLVVTLPSLESLLASRLTTGPRSQTNDKDDIDALLAALNVDTDNINQLMTTIATVAQRSFKPKTRLAGPIHIFARHLAKDERPIGVTLSADEIMEVAESSRRKAVAEKLFGPIARRLGFG